MLPDTAHILSLALVWCMRDCQAINLQCFTGASLHKNISKDRKWWLDSLQSWFLGKEKKCILPPSQPEVYFYLKKKLACIERSTKGDSFHLNWSHYLRKLHTVIYFGEKVWIVIPAKQFIQFQRALYVSICL